jgi:hypothetical protein
MALNASGVRFECAPRSDNSRCSRYTRIGTVVRPPLKMLSAFNRQQVR